jgi:predicted cupin superfamily sugar epimerase
MNQEIERLLNKFNMKPHPEGGYFGAGYRSSEFIRKDCLPKRYNSPRNLYSSIYFMVTPENPSCFHRLNTDEIWHFYSGDPIQLHLIWDKGRYTKVVLSNEAGQEKFQTLIKRGTWMAATTEGPNGYGMAGCTLGPGFEYTDFELADPKKLLEAYPEHRHIIERLAVVKDH